MSTKPSPQSSKLALSLKRFRHRHLSHQLKVATTLSAGLLFTVPPLVQLSAEAWRSLAPRSPLGARVPVVLCADHLDSAGRAHLRASPKSVALHQVKPRLTLVGVGEGVVTLDTPSCAQGFEVGLLPNHADALLHEGTQMVLSMESPSLTLLAEDLLNSPRGARLQERVTQARDALGQEALTLLPQLQERITSKLDPEVAAKLIKDEVLLSALKGAITSELIDRVEWGELGGELGGSKELDQLLGLATEHVRTFEIFRGTWGGLREGVTQGSADITKSAKRVHNSKFNLFDASLCATQLGAWGVGFMSKSAELAGSLALGVLGGSSELCEQVLESGKGVVKSAIKGGATSFAKESFESLRKNQDQALTEAQKLAAKAWERAEGGVRLKGLWLAIAGNQALKNHIMSTYGAPAWDQLQEAVWSVSQSEEVEGVVNKAGAALKQVSKDALSALLLDKEGKGPNPLLLAVIQEQLSGQSRPVVHVTPPPPESPRVSPGYLFTPPSTPPSTPKTSKGAL